MAAVVKPKRQSRKPPSIEETFEENEIADPGSNLSTPLLSKKEEITENYVVDIERGLKTPSNDTVTSGLTQPDYSDGAVIGIITLEDVFEELLQVKSTRSPDSFHGSFYTIINSEVFVCSFLLVNMQEEIVDETDEYVDVHKRYLKLLFQLHSDQMRFYYITLYHTAGYVWQLLQLPH